MSKDARSVGADGVGPSFSIVIPCYEPAPTFLRACMESLFAQTVGSWEAIVVDDASSRIDVEREARVVGDARIRIVRHAANRGEAASRNTGILAARSDLIVALDPDDALAPGYLRQTGAVMEARSDVDWVLTDRQLFGESIDVLRFPVPLPVACPIHLNAQSPGLIRRRLWKRVGGYSEDDVFRSGGADLDFWMSAVEVGAVVRHVPEPLYRYRVHRMSASSNSFRYDNHLIHRSLLRRHRELFRSMSTRCPRCEGRRSIRRYAATGYVVAADASLARGERARAMRLGVAGAVWLPERRSLKQLVRAFEPSAIARRRRTLRRAHV